MSPENTTQIKAAILGLGCAVPAGSFAQSKTAELAGAYCGGTSKQIATLNELYRRTEIASRASVLDTNVVEDFFPFPEHANDYGPGTSSRMNKYAQEVVPLAVSATQAALKDSQCEPDKITHLITVSCTGFFAPGLDIALIKELGLSDEVARTNIGFMGCHGAFNGMQVARAIVEADPESIVLLCSAELCSLHFQYGWNKDNVVANSLFADGAGAVVIGARNSNALWKLAGSGTKLLPNSTDMMTWNIGDNGFVMNLSSQIPDLISENLHLYLNNWLSKYHLELNDIATWAVHPGGPRILDAVQTSLNLSVSALSSSRLVMNKYGNMSSSTLFFVLDGLRTSQTPCVALGFGPGLVIETFLLL